MTTNKTPIVGGYSLTTAHIDAQLYRPDPMRKAWALCFARCTGPYASFTGRYFSFCSMGEALIYFERMIANGG